MSMPATKEFKPFLFDRSFDDPHSDENKKKEEAATAAEAEALAQPAAPMFSEEEVEAARAASRSEGYAEGHTDGYADGRAAAEAEVNAEVARTIELLSHEVARLGERQLHANEQQEAALARVTREIMARLMPAYVRAYGSQEAVDVVEGCLASLQDTGRLTVRCHEPDAFEIERRLQDATAQTAFEGTIRVIPDPEYGPSDISANWGAGGAQRRFKQIWDGIEEAVDTAIEAVEQRLEEAGFVNETGHIPEPAAPEPAVPEDVDADVTAAAETQVTETQVTETQVTETQATETDEENATVAPSSIQNETHDETAHGSDEIADTSEAAPAAISGDESIADEVSTVAETETETETDVGIEPIDQQETSGEYEGGDIMGDEPDEVVAAQRTNAETEENE